MLNEKKENMKAVCKIVAYGSKLLAQDTVSGDEYTLMRGVCKVFPGDYTVGAVIEEEFYPEQLLESSSGPFLIKNTKFGVKILDKGFALFGSKDFLLEDTETLQDVRHHQLGLGYLKVVKGARYLHTLQWVGSAFDTGIETKIALLRYNIQHQTTTEQPAATPEVQRENLTHINFMTIDAESTKDIDDAIAVEYTQAGITAYIGIADVAAAIPMGSELDKVAFANKSSIYMPHETLHMLPNHVATALCSLNPGELKSALVVKAMFDTNFELQDYAIVRATIQSKARLSYNQVDAYFKGETQVPECTQQGLAWFKQYSEHRVETHQENHSDRRFKPNMEYVLNKKGKLDKLIIEDQDTPSVKLVTQAMLLANRLAADFMQKRGIGIFRNQSAPIVKKEKELLQTSVYAPACEGHHSLNITSYTHFTSPIRRLPDLLVHRTLVAELEQKPMPYTMEELILHCEDINNQVANIKKAVSTAENLLYADYVKRFVKMAMPYQILEVLPNGFVVFNQETCIEGFIKATEISEELFTKITNKEIQELTLEIWYYNDSAHKVVFKL